MEMPFSGTAFLQGLDKGACISISIQRKKDAKAFFSSIESYFQDVFSGILSSLILSPVYKT